MRCSRVRETLNSILDGDRPPGAAEAEDHLHVCAECREWHASMSRTIALLGSREEPAMPDIAAMVARQLPTTHPAAVRSRSLWVPVALLALLAMITLAGVVAGMLVWDHASALLSGGWIPQALGAGRTLGSVGAALLLACRAVVDVAVQVLTALARVAAGFGPVLLLAIAANLAILVAAVLICRGRPKTTSACLI